MLNKKQLLQDKAAIEALIQKAQDEIQQHNMEILKWVGALAYIEDNLKEDKK